MVHDLVAQGGTVLFVGTKRQAQATVYEEANRCRMPYVNQRWLGGTLTNWSTIKQRIDYLLRWSGASTRASSAICPRRSSLPFPEKWRS